MSLSPPQSIAELDDLITTPTDGALDAIRRCPGDFLVLGAGGKMGFHFCRSLQRILGNLERTDRVIAASRFSSQSAREQFEQTRIETQAIDLSAPEQLADLPDANNVLFLAGVKFGTSQDPNLLTRMNSVMPRLVAERFQASRIVALSTGCVYSFTTPDSGGSTEQTATEPPGEYARSCLEREQAFTDGADKHGTRSSLVRLNYSIDLRYGVLVDIAQQVKAGLPVDVATGYVNVIWQGDAVMQILQCFPHVNAPPWIINVTGAETLAVRDVATRFAKRFSCQVNFQGTEAADCWLNDSSVARRMFGEPQTSVEQMIDWIANWLERDRETLGKPTKFQNRTGAY